MAHVHRDDVQLRADIRFSQFVTPKGHREVISNKNFPLGDWNRLCVLQTPFEGVYKRVIPVDFRDFCMLVVTEVEANTHVERHVHDEGIVRYIMEGSLTLNDVEYERGDWVLVPEGVAYEITTKTGYKAIAGYLAACS